MSWGLAIKHCMDGKNKFGKSKGVNVSETASTDLAARVAQLERQLAVRDEQIEVLKKAISIVSQPEQNDSI